MSAFIHHELLLLLRTIAVGAVLLLCYDLLAAFRNVFAHSDKAVGTEDILYWLCCAFFVFSEIYRSNEGILRFFMVLGFLSGAYICNRVLGDIFVKCCTKFMEIPVIIIKFLIKWLLFPVKRCKLLWYKAYKYAKKGRLANWVILRKGRKKRVIPYFLGMIAIALVVLVLLGGLMLESNDLKERLTGYDAKAATLQQQIEDEQTRTEEIDKLKKYMETDEYAEEVAREKLGLVKDNETVFKKQQ